MRYTNVTTARSISDLAADIDGIREDVNSIREEIQSLGAEIAADRARNFNSLHRIRPKQHGLNFSEIVKYTPGHPMQHPPGGVMRLDQPHQPVVFVSRYPVKATPPAGLVPQNFDQLKNMRLLGHAALRRAIRGIHWFYNDATLELRQHASMDECMDRLTELEIFLVDA